MHVQHATAVAALLVSLPIGAAAQSAQPPAPSAAQTTNPQVNTPSDADQPDSNRWIASGLVGSNFGNNAESASMEFGGAVDYLLKNKYGVEFDTGFTPDFDLQSNFFGLGITPNVNTFMGNAIYAPALGPDGQWQPFISGGVGAISLRSGLTSDPLNAALSPNDTRLGGDIGGGVTGFSGIWGFKADVRYYRAAGSYNTTLPAIASGNPSAPPSGTPGLGPYGSTAGPTGSTPSTTAAQTMPSGTDQSLASTVLAGLHFWRANVGVALRW
jgi:hypothetical protein